ncbi:nitrilase-related carbon-nitrogen hydrolase [Pseudomonas sp. zfem004]|uniref:nitrilase-related carbon-nitrogen hydrolase n=1 Tax=Pseudomonas sp. zfem004 TaxID=3078199 RepID=UPI0029290542|nr:nitrilase-related carbon-nitrogen hydrolase [Pseudomonas sp. zfem004]MDU9401392.1 nitrilase-related carbon-nitrogen hydrolase [Pseudomonas sp. zfem004]
MNGTYRVACQQLAPQLGQPRLNLERSLAAIRDAALAGARLVVLPELALSGYLFRDRQEAHDHAETRDSPALAAWAAHARTHQVIVVGGFCERLAGGAVANACVLIEPCGRRTFYRKAHLWDGETRIFTPGDQPPPVVNTAIGKVAMMICYDLEFPEWVRLAALGGAQLLCAPVNWPLGPSLPAQRPAEVIRAQANASVNRLFVLACDRCGEERGTQWVGGTALLDADGHLLAGGDRSQHTRLLLADITPAEADDKRISTYNHVLEDRRPDLYRGLL